MLLASTVLFPVVRKLLPGQPSYLEVGSSAIVGILLLSNRAAILRIKSILLYALGLYVLFELIYAVRSLTADWRIGAAAVASRILPTLACLLGAVYSASGAWQEVSEKFSRLLVLLTFPAVLAALATGTSDILPVFLQPNKAMFELGRDQRSGVAAFAGPFSTQAVAAFSFLAVLAMLCGGWGALILSKRGRLDQPGLRRGLFIIVCLAIIYATTRRGALYAGLLVAMVAVIQVRLSIGKKVLVLLASVGLMAVLYLTREVGIRQDRDTVDRVTLMTSDIGLARRFTDIVFPIYTYWAQNYPWGSYLGALGPEGVAFNGALAELSMSRQPVEIGLALIQAEKGYVGLVLFLTLYGWLLVHTWRGIRRGIISPSEGVFCLVFLSSFLAKECTVMTAPYLHNLAFHLILGAGLGVASNTRISGNPALERPSIQQSSRRRSQPLIT